MSVNGFTFGTDPTIQKYNYESLDNIPDIENGTYPNMAVGSLIGENKVTDKEPYFLRPSASIGDREFDTLVGGTLGWNQLCNGSSVTVTSGHKYYMIKGGTASVGASDGTAITGLTSGTDIVIDLTALFGSTIADYIYSLEQATAGAGVAWVKKYLPNDYYAYCAPTLKHVSGVSAHVMRDANDNVIGNYPIDSTWVGMGIPKLDSSNKLYFDGDRYSADGTVTEKYTLVDLGSYNWTVGNNKLVYTYGLASVIAHVANADLANAKMIGYDTITRNAAGYGGTVLVKGCGVDVGGAFFIADPNMTWTSSSEVKTALTGTYALLELSTPTTSSASPYTSPQICDPDGTEEYVSTGLVPVGHETEYAENLADKLTDIPDLPTTAGTYRLKVTVSGGVPSYSWVTS